MNTTEKRKYIIPEIIQIQLDNEISLQLESTQSFPPSGPDESINSITPGYLINDPFKSAIG